MQITLKIRHVGTSSLSGMAIGNGEDLKINRERM